MFIACAYVLESNQQTRPWNRLLFQQPFEDYLEASIHMIQAIAKTRGLATNAPEIQAMYKELHEKFGMIGFPEKRQPIIDKYGLTA